MRPAFYPLRHISSTDNWRGACGIAILGAMPLSRHLPVTAIARIRNPAPALPIALTVVLLALAGCSTPSVSTVAGPIPAPAAVSAKAGKSTAAPEVTKYGNFTEDQLTRSIMAELAGQRGQNAMALNEYAKLARETSNVSIIERAMHIAAFSREPNLAIEMGELWLLQDPQAVEPRQTIALELVSLARYRDAFHQFDLLLEQNEEVDFRLLSARIAATAGNGTPVLSGLIDDYEGLLKRYPLHESLRLSLAHLYQLDKQPKPALAIIEQMLKEVERRDRDSKLPSDQQNGVKGGDLVILQVQLLELMADHATSLRKLQQGVHTYADHKELRLLYGRRLINDHKFPEAREQFSLLVQQNPGDYDMLYSLALLSMEVNQLDEARNYLQRLVLNGQKLDDAHYYLGYIDGQQNQAERAIEQYKLVKAGSNFLQALRNLTELMVRAGRYDELHSYLQNIRFRNSDLNIQLLTIEANTLITEKKFDIATNMLNNSVGAFPNNVDLLFLRSVLSQDTNDLVLMESDLRKIILLQPQSPVAYNSLGYTLADRTNRYQEAYDLIKHAAELDPNDPAIMDSLGWVQYKLGKYREAREILDKAYKLYPDPEVAAHLGEVLWVLGERSAATKIWRSALTSQPDSVYVRNTIQRLDPSASF